MFYDLATRLVDKIRFVKEAESVTTSVDAPDVEQLLTDLTGGDETLVKSTWSSEMWYKFWMLRDGTLIPVKHTHSDTIRDASYAAGVWFGTETAQKAGVIRGHVDPDLGFMSITTVQDLTDAQIKKIKKLYLRYWCRTLRFLYRGRGRTDRSFDREGEDIDHIDYLLRYGPEGMNEKKRKLKEDGAAGPSAGPVNGPAGGGATTENDIAALPTELGRRRGRKKRKTPVIKMKEAVDEDLGRLRRELKTQMVKMMNRDEFAVTSHAAQVFQSVFGSGRPRTQRTAITCERQQKDAQKLYGDLLREHGNDKGSLEMLISSMQEGRPLGQLTGMTKYDYLYGTRVEVGFGDITLIFEAKVDFIYDPTQTIYIDDVELVDRIEEEFGSIIKRRKNMIYPVGGKFKPDFFKQLKSMIQEPEHEEESEQTA